MLDGGIMEKGRVSRGSKFLIAILSVVVGVVITEKGKWDMNKESKEEGDPSIWISGEEHPGSENSQWKALRGVGSVTKEWEKEMIHVNSKSIWETGKLD